MVRNMMKVQNVDGDIVVKKRELQQVIGVCEVKWVTMCCSRKAV
jgi:hypothetical protein